MDVYAMTPDLAEETAGAIRACSLLSGLNEHQARQVAGLGHLVELDAGELLLAEGAQSDSVWILLSGEAAVLARDPRSPLHARALRRVRRPDLIGEIGVLLAQPRSASVQAVEPVRAFRLPGRIFAALCQHNASVAFATALLLASRLSTSVSLDPTVTVRLEHNLPPPPDGRDDIDDRTPVRTELLALERGGAGGAAPGRTGDDAPVPAGLELVAVQNTVSTTGGASPPSLERLLRLMLERGASDLHLCAGQRPRLRVNGALEELTDHRPLEPTDAFSIFEHWLDGRHLSEFEEERDTDFAHFAPGIGRFRVNLFRDTLGSAAAIRAISARIMTFDELRLPPVVPTLCDHPNGLVLVTGATGSGKSTTLAAMIDHINRTRAAHIITLEDPVEYVHESRRSLVNQREVGGQAKSFTRALRAALREDPDVVLVGEMRDLETVNLTLELAATGHLVFASLHTHSAAGAVERIVGMYPDEQQSRVRLLLADVLRGIVSQTLVKRTDGTRQVAAEVLVATHAFSNLIRENKPHQIQSLLETGKTHGNLSLNDELARLIRVGSVDYEEASSKSRDKNDLLRRLNQRLAVAR